MLSESAKVISVNVTFEVHTADWTKPVGSTGIDKRPVVGRINLAGNSLQGDVISDRENHGGFDQAVYAYAREDYEWWEGKWGIAISYGSFGENLTSQAVDVTQAIIGKRWSIGTALLEVSQPRIPCRVFAGFWNRPNLIKEFTSAGRPGAYLRIIQEGHIGDGDVIDIADRPSHGVTISDLFAARGGERALIREILQVPQLSASYRAWAISVNDSNREN
jgi:MOSC domain-containing protein YiiM